MSEALLGSKGWRGIQVALQLSLLPHVSTQRRVDKTMVTPTAGDICRDHSSAECKQNKAARDTTEKNS
jgi:hypothetical protein